MTVLITLTLAGPDVGPFNLFSDVDSYAVAFETGVTRADLVAGYTSILVPTETTEIMVESVGTCERQLYLIVQGAPTTTTTTSSTTSTSTTYYPPPPTSILTFDDYTSGKFYFSLTTPLSVPLVIDAATVSGSTSETCRRYEEGDDITPANTLTIPATMSSGNVTGITPMTNDTKSWKKSNIINIVGIGSVNNGDIVNIGGTLVTISINLSCNVPYYS